MNIVQVRWWDIAHRWRRLQCFFFGHPAIDSVATFHRDPNCREARELAALWHQVFGSPFVCLRCHKPIGDL